MMNIYMKNEFLNLVDTDKITPLCSEWVCSDILHTTHCKQPDINLLVMQILNWHLEYMKELKKRWAEELNKTS